MIRFFLATTAIMVSFSCSAGLRITSPDHACTVLSDTRLRANTWSTSADGTEGCSSPVRDVSADSTSGNTIRFVAQGADHVPEHLSLIIDIASPSLADDAKREMIKATKRLSVRALGLSIPHKIDESILKGENVQLEVGSGVVTITRTNRAQGAYQLTLTMR